MRTGEERFPTLWAALLQEHGEDGQKTTEAVLGLAFLERLDPEQGEWTWLNVGKWASIGFSVFGAALSVLAMVGDGNPVLWLCLAALSGAAAWECNRRLRKPSHRELQARLQTSEQHQWFVRLETCRARFEAGKRSAMRERGNGGSFIKSEAFAGLNGLRLIVRSGAIDARATAQELFVEVPRAVLSERARSRDTVASLMPKPRGDEHDMGLSIVPVSTIRETEHPFSGIAESAFAEALNKYLEAAPKSLSEKDQFRYVNLETWKIVQRDPCLQTGQIAAKVREGAEKRGRHIEYTDDVLGKIVGSSASSTYGAFKAFLIKQGLVL
ncbi:hypothetical protein IP81_17080 [Novosphingobium sp. AAP83]|nr:hypothetical protein IP81_17080 [Novosphingobium sp. AAP83]